MLLVVPDLEWKAAVRAQLDCQTTVSLLALEVQDGLPEQVIARLRRQHGPRPPLAYLAPSELAALDAIAAGADEALALRREDSAQVLVLMDRAVRRAHKRQALEQAQAHAARSEKLAALEAVVAGVAHEINNPLAAISLSVELLRTALEPLPTAGTALARGADLERGLTAHEVQVLASRLRLEHAVESGRVLDDLLDLVGSCAAIVRDLRSYARASDDDPPELVELPTLIEQALRIVGSELSALAHIEREYQEGLPRVLIPRARIVQVLTNLFINAMHAMRDVARPLHRLRVSVRADDEAVAISIADTGTGIAPEMLDNIFDPFFTTKGDGRGSGLGLSISRSIMLRIGGDLLVESVHGTGATFIMFIPRPSPAALRGSVRIAPAPAPPQPARKPSLLLVEDDQRLLRLFARVLGEHFDVILAADGQEAIELLTSGTRVDAVVSDLTMPDVDGTELYRFIRSFRPELCERVVFVTGADDVRSQHFLASVPNLSLPKPVASEKLIATLQRVLAR